MGSPWRRRARVWCGGICVWHRQATCAGAFSDARSYGFAHALSQPDTFAHAYAFPHANTFTYAFAYGFPHTLAQPDQEADAQADADRGPYAFSHAAAYAPAFLSRSRA